MSAWDFLVDRGDLNTTNTVPAAAERALVDGEARLRVDAFGFTANNITYAVFGDLIGYWNFFPAPDLGDGVNWGRVPVWGFGTVIESKAIQSNTESNTGSNADGESEGSGLAEGARVFGYLPMSTELIVKVGHVGANHFVDASDHRAVMPVTYNRYQFTATDPAYDAELEDEQMLLRPLYATGFVIDAWLEREGWFGASQVIATSASSKTAIATAHLVNRHPNISMVGLTSAGNVDFVEGLGCYDQVITYDQLLEGASLSNAEAVLVDFAGNAAVVRAVHTRLGDRLKHSSRIGGTHWDAGADDADPLPGPPPEFFFAPAHIEQLNAERGTEQLTRQMSEAWPPFVERVQASLKVEHLSGADAVRDVYLENLAGTASATVAKILHPEG